MNMLAHRDFSTLTDRYQTTVPSSIRKVLKLHKRDKLCYNVETDGRVYIESIQDTPDPALGAFLDLLQADVIANPQRLSAFDGALHDRLSALIGDVDVDLDAKLSPDDE
ncbi:MAG: type II toxin-antitoxin system PrlF family antitoxin [Rhodobacteraceae bacterium]|nr:type II toxin-antitoxin system PrlF family antitoxin [Paracoccaceae bacterium]